jgi:hypothetical protein
MRRSYFILYCLSLVFLFASCSNEDAIEKYPTIENKYDSSQPTAVTSILPTRGIIDQTFVIYGNFPGDISGMKVYFGDKKAVLTATDGKTVTGLVPKQPDGLNQISFVVGTDSLAPATMLFKYKQSRSVSTISGKFLANTYMTDANYAGAALDAVTYGNIDYVAAVAGQKADNIIAIGSGWGDKMFLLSQDDYKVTKLSTPGNLCSPAVTSTRDRIYVTRFWYGMDHPILFYAKENNWEYAATGITLKQADFTSGKVNSMTLAEDDNLLYVMDDDGRIAEVNLKEKFYKIYASAAKKPSGVDPNNWGGLITGDLPTSFSDWRGTFITYSKYHHCFFASFRAQNAIYKLVKNADNTWTSTLHAGNNGQGIAVGDRLKDAQFCHPEGLVVNADGDIFVCNSGGNYWEYTNMVISKIAGGAVSIVAGNKNNSSSPLQNGDPLEATFHGPRMLSIDSDGNYIIAGGEDNTVRKLSIE